MISFLISVTALFLVMMVWLSNRAILRNYNLLLIRLDQLERKATPSLGQSWVAMIQRKRSSRKDRIELIANSESDALRQLIARGIDYRTVVLLDPALPTVVPSHRT